MNRAAKTVAALALATLTASALARPTHAEPDPIELDRLPGVTVQVWRDFGTIGEHDPMDMLLATTVTDLSGYWAFTGLATNHMNRLIVARLNGYQQGIRIGGDVYRFNQFGFAPIDGAPVELLADEAQPTTYYGGSDAVLDNDVTHCVGAYKCGDFRLRGATTPDAQGIVVGLSGTPATFSGYRGFLWDATHDDD